MKMPRVIPIAVCIALWCASTERPAAQDTAPNGARLYQQQCASCHDAGAARAPYEPVNGVPARGGSLDGPGAAIGGGMLYFNSGYHTAGGMPGNVLLAFSIDGK